MTASIGGASPHLLRDGMRSRDEVVALLELAASLKIARERNQERALLAGKQIAIVFEQPSTRTRAAFEVAAREQGAGATYIDTASSHLGVTESAADSAQVLGHFYDGIAFRGDDQRTVEVLAAHAGVPIWNALTREWHPTQALADFLTMREYAERQFSEISVCFAGDGRNNVAHSLLVTGALLGLDVRIAAPSELQPEPTIVSEAQQLASASAARLTITSDVNAAVRGADFVCTDVWVSMGEPDELWDEREALLMPYRVDMSLLARTENPGVRFMHCLPSIHDDSTVVGRRVRDRYGLVGAEVSDEVFGSRHSVVFQQAENRMHTIKALLIDSLAADR